MFSRTLHLRPLVKYQSVRGMADAAAKPGLAGNVQKIVNYVITTAKSEASKKAMRAAMIELRPPTPAEIPRAIRDGIHLFTRSNWREVTVRDAFRNTLVTAEVLCWFFVGEVLGKGTLIGYQV